MRMYAAASVRCALALVSQSPRAAGPTVVVDAAAPAGYVSPPFYGLMTEEIFVGEWGTYETPFVRWDARSRTEAPTPNMRAALGDAAWTRTKE